MKIIQYFTNSIKMNQILIKIKWWQEIILPTIPYIPSWPRPQGSSDTIWIPGPYTFFFFHLWTIMCYKYTKFEIKACYLFHSWPEKKLSIFPEKNVFEVNYKQDYVQIHLKTSNISC